MNQPNILFILTDQQHFRMLSCAGNEYISTPAMDSLAADGLRFDRAYCANPVCGASRFSIFTGCMPSEIGLWSNYPYWIPDTPQKYKSVCLGNRMRDAGYDAIYGGKPHLPGMTPAETGFDYFCKDERDGLARDCADFLRQKRDKPFCLVASFINPHDICNMAIGDGLDTPLEKADFRKKSPLETQALDRALSRPTGVDEELFFERYCPPLPVNFQPQTDEPEAIRFMFEMRPFRLRARREWSDRRWREHRWAYARLIEEVDGQIGRVLAGLREGPHADNTLVVFTSDHGDMDASHRMEHKSTLYDESVRIPLIIRPPGRRNPSAPGPVDRAHLVSIGLDLLPTFCDYAGVAQTPGTVGQSLRPLVEGRRIESWRQVVPIETAIARAIVTERFKYARYDLGERPEQLIDLRADPHEQRNAVHDPELADPLRTLRAQFDETFGRGPRPPALEIFRALEFS